MEIHGFTAGEIPTHVLQNSIGVGQILGRKFTRYIINNNAPPMGQETTAPFNNQTRYKA